MKAASATSGRAAAATATAVARGGAAPARPAPLRANFAWTLAGNVVYAASQWGILIVIARLAPPDAVGRIALGYAVAAPVFLLTGLHLRASQATDAGRRYTFADYRCVRLGGMAVAMVATAVIVSISRYDRGTALVVLAVGASKAVEGVSDVYYGLLQQNEHMRPIAISLTWRGVLAVSAVGAVLWAGGGLVVAVSAVTASWLAVLLAYDRRAAAPFLPAAGRSARHVDWSAASGIVTTCVPLGLVMMLVSLRINVPRYFIQATLGPAELGIFAALSSLLAAGTVVVSALGQSATPRLAYHFHEGDLCAFRRLLARLLAVAALVGGAGLVVTAAAGEPLLRVLLGARYAQHDGLLVALMMVGLVSYAASFLGYALTSARRFTIQLPLFAATTLVCAGACQWLVPAHRLLGAAIAWGGSLLVELVAIWILLVRTLRGRAAGGAA